MTNLQNSVPGPAGPPPGLTVGGYELLHRLGEGGMGVVHLARRPDGPRVALKVLRPHIIGDSEARARLAQEVNSLSRIKSHRVAEIVDADPFGDIPYVATRYVPGYSLHQQIEAEGAITGEDLTWFARCLVEALSAVHSVGVLHRDIKPSNVLMEGRSPVLIDFGLARLAEDNRITQAGWLLGTPGYLAPEILYGDDASPASDVHSWAATVGYAGTGRAPFGSGPSMAVMDRVRRGEFNLEGIDGALGALLRAALSPEPEDRPTLRDLREWFDPGAAVTSVHRATPGSLNYPVPPQPVEPEFTVPLVAMPQAQDQAQAPVPEPIFQPFAGSTAVLPEGAESTQHLGPDEPDVSGPPDLWSQARSLALIVGSVLATGALFATAPWITLVVLTLVVWLVGSLAAAGESLQARREVRGHKWYDTLLQTFQAPWHAVRSFPHALMLVAWGAGMGFAALLVCYALSVSAVTTLMVSGVVLAGSLWVGPGTEEWARPMVRIAAPVVARPVVWAFVCVGLVALTTGLLAAAGTGINWAPAGAAPFGFLR